jgi:hypothetical protein
MEMENSCVHHKHSHKDRSKWYSSSSSEKYKSIVCADDTKKTYPPHWDDKMEDLCTYRNSKGMCFTFGHKWSRTHKFLAQIPLHVMDDMEIFTSTCTSTGDT